MIWYISPGVSMDCLGIIPSFLTAADPRPAADQFADRYCGGWDSFKGFTMNDDGSLEYPDDPTMPVLASTQLGDEVIRVYEHGWVSVTQPDGTFDVARLD